jgi:hypothetical protein
MAPSITTPALTYFQSATSSFRANATIVFAAFAALADKLDALAGERAKPWWRRLAG